MVAYIPTIESKGERAGEEQWMGVVLLSITPTAIGIRQTPLGRYSREPLVCMARGMVEVTN